MKYCPIDSSFRMIRESRTNHRPRIFSMLPPICTPPSSGRATRRPKTSLLSNFPHRQYSAYVLSVVVRPPSQVMAKLYSAPHSLQPVPRSWPPAAVTTPLEYGIAIPALPGSRSTATQVGSSWSRSHPRARSWRPVVWIIRFVSGTLRPAPP